MFYVKNREFISSPQCQQLTCLSLSVMVISFPTNGLFATATNEQGLWKVGYLKHVRPNVCRYKLLMFKYLQMFNRFPFAENKSTKELLMFNYFRQPPLATNLCWRLGFFFRLFKFSKQFFYNFLSVQRYNCKNVTVRINVKYF